MTIRNDIHGTETRVRVTDGKLFTPHQQDAIRRRLCPYGLDARCNCSIYPFGMRGPQEMGFWGIHEGRTHELGGGRLVSDLIVRKTQREIPLQPL